MTIDWDSTTWGQPGHNTHESSTGSWTTAEAGDSDV